MNWRGNEKVCSQITKVKKGWVQIGISNFNDEKIKHLKLYSMKKIGYK